jgi:hypothetical protein
MAIVAGFDVHRAQIILERRQRYHELSAAISTPTPRAVAAWIERFAD